MRSTFKTRSLHPRTTVLVEPPLYRLYQRTSQFVFLFLIVTSVFWLRSCQRAASIPGAEAAEQLTFATKFRHIVLRLPVPKKEGYWHAPDQPAYKTERLIAYQEKLRERGVTNPDHLKLFVAQLFVENGAISEDRDGDHGCSIGIPQRNTCLFRDPVTGKRFTAKTFRLRYPAWKDWRTQIAWMADQTAATYKRFDGNAKCTIIFHNRPASALHGCQDTAAGYYRKITARSSSLSLL